MTTYTYRDIKNNYLQKKDWEKQFPVSYYLFRPLSFPISYVVLRFTTSPSRVAWVGFSLGLAGCVAFLCLKEVSIWPGAVLLLLCALSDAVDGNVARTTHSVTYYGKLLDGLLGAAVEGSYGFFLGLGFYRAGEAFPFIEAVVPGTNIQPLFIIIGAIFTIGWFFSNLIAESYEKVLSIKEMGQTRESLTNQIQSSRFRNHIWYRLFINLHAVNLQLLILVLMAAIGRAPLFLLIWAIYYVVRVAVHFTFYLHRAGEVLS